MCRFKCFGIKTTINASVMILVFLITYILIKFFLPKATKQNYSSVEYFIGGLFGSVLIIASILLHEIAHIYTAKYLNLVTPHEYNQLHQNKTKYT